MAWTAPRTWVTGELVTAALMNTHIKDNLTFLATKEFWQPATYNLRAGVVEGMSNLGDFPAAQAGLLNDRGQVSARCPSDFGAIVTAELIIGPMFTQANANWDIDSDYGAVGQAYNTHSEADAAATYNVVANQLFALDVSGILSALAADDYIGLNLKLSDGAHDFMLLGFFMKYTIA